MNELNDIIGSIDELADRGSLTRSGAFAAWFAINFFAVDEDDALESAGADGGNDQGIDIVFADDSTQEILVIQAHCPENTTKITPRAKWDAIVSSTPYIEDPSNLVKLGRPDLAEAVALLKGKHPEYQVSFGLISLGKRSSDIENSLKAHQKSKKETTSSFFYYAQEELIDKFRALTDSEGGISSDCINFVGPHFEDKGTYGRAWIGSVSAKELQ